MRGIGEVEHRHSGDFRERMVEQVKAVDVGHEADDRRRLAQRLDDGPDALFLAQRQCDPDLVARAGHRIVGQLRERPGDRNAFDHAAFEARIVVVEGPDVESTPGRGANAARDVASVLARPDDHHVAQILAAQAQCAQHQARGRAQ